MKPVFLLLMMIAGVMGCSEEVRPKTDIVSTLQQLEELATVEYTVTKVVKANDNKTWFKPGDRKILMTTEAAIKAGINMAGLKADDVIVSGKKITIYLPEPKILSVSMPPEKIKVAFEKSDLFRYPFSNEERDALLIQAEQQIRESGNETGILTQARINTQVFLSSLLQTLGFDKVELHFGENTKSNRG